MKKVRIWVLLASILSIFLLSCEIGLGAAVDTTAPVISISNPPVDAVVRDAFAFSGSYSDDGTVIMATISLTGVNVSGSYSFGGSLSGTSWSCTIDPVASGIPDGTYEAIVTLMDYGGHTSSSSRAFTIDNTAPIVFLQRPGSRINAEESDVDTYGQEFSIQGQVADDNSISQMKVSVYSDEATTQLLKTITIANVPQALNVSAAKFGDDSYTAIYGDTLGDKLKRYCKIVCYDDAQRYPVGSSQSDADKLGNARDYFYLRDEVATSVLSNYKVNDIYHMFSGTLAQNSTVMNTLNDSKYKISEAMFYLNPQNSPYFSVTGMTSSTSADIATNLASNDLNFTRGSQLIVDVKQGSDGYPLLNTTEKPLKLWVSECNSNGVEINEDNRKYLNATDDSLNITKNGTDYRIITLVDRVCTIGKPYIIGVDGEDQNGGSIATFGKIYAFNFCSNGAAPVITITAPSASTYYVKKETDVTIAGTVKVEASAAVTIKIYKDINSPIKTYTESSTELTKPSDGSSDTYTFSYVIPYSNFTENAENIIRVGATSNGTTTVSKTIVYDTNGPNISLTVSPLASTYYESEDDDDYKSVKGSNYINGTITLKGQIVDEFDSVETSAAGYKPKYEIIRSDTEDVISSGVLSTSFTQTIDTNSTGFVDGKDYIIRITAYDRALNKSVTTDTSYTYHLLQSTDKPVFFPNGDDWKLSYDSKEFLNGKIAAEDYTNVFLGGSNLVTKIYDEDGIASTKVTIYEDDEETVEATCTGNGVEKSISGNPVETINMTVLPNALGAYKVVYLVEDINGKSTTKRFWIQIRGTAPTVQLTSTPTLVTTSSTNVTGSAIKAYTITLDMGGSTGPFKIYRSNTLLDGNVTSSTFTDTFTPAANSNSAVLVYKVVDIFGATAEPSLSYQVDKTAPTASFTQVPNATTSENASVVLIGTASDGTEGNISGVSSVQIAFSDGTATTPATTPVTANGTTSWNYTLTFADYAGSGEVFSTEGSKKLYVRAIDNVGNIGAWTTTTFVYDKAKPSLTVQSYTPESGSATTVANGGEFNVGKKFSLSGIMSDTYGIQSLSVTQKKDDGDAVTLTDTFSTTSPWTITNLPRNPTSIGTHSLATGDYVYTITVTDNSDKTTTTTVTTHIDVTAPTITITAPSSLLLPDNSGVNSFSGSTYQFTGTSSDVGLGVQKIQYILSNSATLAGTETWKDVTTTGNWNFSQYLVSGTTDETENTLHEGKWYLHARAVDKANNISTTTVAAFYVDQSAPTLSQTGFNDGSTKYVNAALPITITATDTYGIEDTAVTAMIGSNSISLNRTSNSWAGNIATTLLTANSSSNVDVTVTDKAGRKVTKTYAVYYDTASPTVSVISPVNGESISSFPRAISGTSSDAGIGVDKVYYTLASTPSDDLTDSSWKILTPTGESWTADLITTDPENDDTTSTKITDEGTYTLTVTAKDKLSNTKATNVQKTFYYDLSNPTLSVNSVTSPRKDEFVISGTAWDGNNINKIEIKEGSTLIASTAGSGTSAITITSGTIAAAKSDSTKFSWSKTMAVGSGNVTDGEHTYTIIATDVAGKTTERNINVTIDTTAPTVTLTDDSVPTTAETEFTSFTFNGTASDNLSLASVEVAFSDPTADPAPTFYTVTGKESWTYTGVFSTISGFDTEGTKTLYARATDSVGNVSAWTSKGYVYDKSVPTVTIDKYNSTTISNASFETKDTFSMSGTISDAYGLADSGSFVITQKKGDGSPITLSGNMTVSGNTWTVTGLPRKDATTSLTSSDSDDAWSGVYTYSVTAKDKAAKTNSVEAKATIDKVAPETVVISSPASDVSGADSLKGSSYNFKGYASDSGTGVNKIYYAFSKTSTAPSDDSDWTSLTVADGEIWTIARDLKTGHPTLGDSDLDEGNWYLYVKAEDKAGNVSSVKTRAFSVDQSAPVLTTDTTALITNTSFTLSGTATDTNAIAKVVITNGKTGDDLITWSSEGTTPAITLNTTTGAWSKTFTTGTSGDVADGTYSFTIQAEDVAGEKTTTTKSITVDTVLPNISAKSFTWGDGSTKTWHNKNNPTLNVSVIENNISTVSYYIAEYSGTYPDVGDISANEWTSISQTSENPSGTHNFTRTLTLNDGTGRVYLKVVDIAGNTSYVSGTELAYQVDTENPIVLISTPTNNTLTNGASDISVTGTISDTVCKDFTKVEIYLNSVSGTAIATLDEDDDPATIVTTGTDGEFTFTGTFPQTSIPDSGDSFKIYVKAYDVAGNVNTTYSNMILDKTAPSVSITLPTNADTDGRTGVYVNGTIALSGTASDNKTLDKVELFYKTADDTWKKYGEATGSNAYNWSFTGINTKANPAPFGTYSTTDGIQTVYLKATATDEAGNKTDTTATFYIDQDTDRPVIGFTNVDLTGMTLSNLVNLQQTSKIYGTVTDDDGVSSLQYSIDNGTNWNTITVTNGSWNQTFADGALTVMFKVTDSNGTVYTSSTDSTGPKLTDGTNTYKSDTNLYLRIDTTSPLKSNLLYSVYDSTTSTYGSYASDYSTEFFGGIHPKFSIKIDAKDANAISSVVGTLTGKKKDNTDYSKTYSATCADVSHSDAEYHTWEIDDIAVTKDSDDVELADGSFDLTIVITDGAGLTSQEKMTISIDNTAPVITIIPPSTQISNAETIRGSLDSDSTVYYAVSRYNNIVPTDTAVTNQSTAWTQETAATLSWSVYFDGDEVTGQTHTTLFRNYIWNLGIATQDAVTSTPPTYTDITTLYVWIKAVDKNGNVSTKYQAVVIDPQGNRPKLTLTYPDADDIKLGGTIRIYGTVTDDVKGKYVWLQIDSDGDGVFEKSDLQYLKDNSYKIGKISTNTKVTDISSVTDSTAGDYGIMITVNGASWNQSINTNGEFDPESGTKTVKMWMYATDEDVTDTTTPNISTVVERTIIVDKDTPVIDNASLRLVQYQDGATSGTVVASQAFTEGMSVKGVWYLTGTITDASGIKEIKKNGTTVVSSAGANSAPEFISNQDAGTGIYNYKINVPLGNATTDSVGTSSVTIRAVENTDNNLAIEKSFSVIYDNKAPVLTTTGSDFKISSSITNSNGFYTFGSKANEDAVGSVNQTGVDKIAFYFTRDITSANTHNLYDVMMKNGVTGNAISSYSSLTSSDGLYWKTISITEVNGAAITISSSDVNVHKGGLAKVNGIIYRIEDISGTTITLSGEPGDTSTAFNGYFAIANVVDNTISEGNSGSLLTSDYGYGYYSAPNYDDGDLMVESLISQGTTYTWQANINSKNIPDGPVVLHYVVFDKAGNSATGTVDAFVKNNQPRIVGMKIGTDDSGNGSVDNSEFLTTWSDLYTSGYDGNDNKITDVTFPSQTNGLKSALTAKAITKIKPEIVGGNGNIGYTFEVAKNLTTTTWDSAYYKKTAVTSLGSGSTDDTLLTLSDITLDVKDFLTEDADNNEIEDANYQKFSFKLWDSTPGTTQGTDSQYATINVIMNVAIRDTVAAKAYINPFFWNSKDDNSLYGNSIENGHIELPEDLPDTFTGDAATGTTIYAKRPKVSGKIKIEGVAYDNILLSSIKATLGNFTTLGSSGTVTIGTYADDTWTAGSTDIATNGWASEIGKATYGEIKKAGLITTLPEGKESSDVVPYTSQEYGHVVHWILYLDSSKVTGIANLKNLISVTASDKGCPSLSGGDVVYTPNTFSAVTGQTGEASGDVKLTSQYTVDVVPYITGVTTSLSTLKTNNASVYSRTALGHYPVKDGESVDIYGFNLAANASKVTQTISASGAITLTTNGISVMNNSNKDDAKGSYTGTTSNVTGDYTVYSNYYNRKPNNDNNNNLTDDVVFDVWQFNNQAAKPISGIISDPVMKISPTSGMLGFAFTNGPLYFSMPGTTDSYSGGSTGITDQEYSYVYWQGSYDFMSSVGLAYDSAGHTYGCAAGGDINSTSADRFSFMTDRWGVSGKATTGSYGGTNAIRLEAIGQYGDSSGADTDILNFDKTRIKSPSYATYRSGSSTNIYLAYFDNLNGEIRFRYGNLADDKDEKTNFNNFNDAYRNNVINNDANLSKGKYSTNYVQVIANEAGASLGYSGEYLSLGTTSDGKVVLVWYDSTNSKLMYAYNSNPTAGTTGKNKTNWSTPIEIFDGAGEYCQLVVDAGNGIHIAAYDGNTGDLKYAYLSAYNDTAADTCTVDSYAIVGQNITIDVARESTTGNYIPHIGYYALSSARPKYAKLVGSSVADGVDSNDVYTGVWESTLIPTTSKMVQDRINVGVWKTTAGVIKNSTTGDSSAGQYYGRCYGNGKANAILAYAIKPSSTTGYIETAQMK